MLTILDQTVELFEEARRESGNYYLYFELAYTKHTGWMCWLQDRTGGEAHKVNLTSPGQADEPGVACVPVRNYLQAWKNCGWKPGPNPPPVLPNVSHPFDGKWTLHDTPPAPLPPADLTTLATGPVEFDECPQCHGTGHNMEGK